METNSNDIFDIEGMSELLFKMHNAINELKKNDILSNDSFHEIKKMEVYALLWAARIDVTICFKNIKPGINKYEGCFFLNLAFMKMYAIMTTVYFIITKTNEPLHYNPHPESRKEIDILITEWKSQYKDWINQKRNNSTAHYEKDFLEFISNGYMEIDREKNQECFISFYKAIQTILDSIQKYDPINLENIGIDANRFYLKSISQTKQGK